MRMAIIVLLLTLEKIGVSPEGKELCKAMNWSTTGGNTKIKHLKELDSLCKWHKEGKNNKGQYTMLH